MPKEIVRDLFRIKQFYEFNQFFKILNAPSVHCRADSDPESVFLIYVYTKCVCVVLLRRQ